MITSMVYYGISSSALGRVTTRMLLTANHSVTLSQLHTMFIHSAGSRKLAIKLSQFDYALVYREMLHCRIIIIIYMYTHTEGKVLLYQSNSATKINFFNSTIKY